MLQRRLGKTDLMVGVVSFGGIIVMDMDAASASAAVDGAVSRGVNFFDVAPMYGDSQYVLGPALKPHRAKVLLACKSDKRNAQELRRECEESLKALHTDYFDLYQLHMLDKPSDIETVFGPGGAMEALLALKRDGLARYIGFTCHTDEAALSIMARHDFDTMLMPVNYAFRLLHGGSGEAIKACKEKDMGVIAIKALARRMYRPGEPPLYPKSWYLPIHDDPVLARMALNYTLSLGADTAVSPGYPPLLPLMLDIIEKQNGQPVPPADEDLAALRREAEAVGKIAFC